MKTIALLASLVALTGSSLAQPPTDNQPEKAAADNPPEKAAADNPPEKTAVLANDRAYESAYAKADAKIMAGFFAEDADYTTSDGRAFSGREAIEGAIRDGLAASPGSNLAIGSDVVRVLGPDTVLEKGTTIVTAKDGGKETELYTAIHIKKDGNWKISQLIESPVPALAPSDRLAELGWLIGQWEETDKAEDLKISSEYSWARGGNFLTRNVTVRKSDEVTLEGWQIIGWDPVEERLRSWTFDGDGGYAEGPFTRDGNRWLLRETGVAPDGSRTSSDSTFTKISDDRFTWESNNRTLDGDPQPGIGRIEINRVKGK